MAEHANISQILATLGEFFFNVRFLGPDNCITVAQQPGGNTAPSQHLPPRQPQSQPPHQSLQQPQHQYFNGFSSGYSQSTLTGRPPTGAPAGAVPYNIPPPSNSGSIDLSRIKPISSGSIGLDDTIARARGITTENNGPYGNAPTNGGKLIRGVNNELPIEL